MTFYKRESSPATRRSPCRRRDLLARCEAVRSFALWAFLGRSSTNIDRAAISCLSTGCIRKPCAARGRSVPVAEDLPCLPDKGFGIRPPSPTHLPSPPSQLVAVGRSHASAQRHARMPFLGAAGRRANLAIMCVVRVFGSRCYEPSEGPPLRLGRSTQRSLATRCSMSPRCGRGWRRSERMPSFVTVATPLSKRPFWLGSTAQERASQRKPALGSRRGRGTRARAAS